MKKDAMNLKERKEDIREAFEGGNGRRKCCTCIIILKIKLKKG